MRRLAGALSLLALLGATALLAAPAPIAESATAGLLVIVGVGAAVALCWQVWGSVGAADDALAPPWTDEGRLAADPERTPDDRPLSGHRQAALVAAAAERARTAGAVEDGIAAVREDLRETLVDVLVHGSEDRAAARDRVAAGTWTDDPVAAAVLEPSIRRPDWPLRERVRAWLFPERVVREQVARAVAAIDESADARLPTVPGSDAPRTVRVPKPRLETLRRGADGRLQRAVDPAKARPAIPGTGGEGNGAATAGRDSADGASEDRETDGEDVRGHESRRAPAGGVEP